MVAESLAKFPAPVIRETAISCPCCYGTVVAHEVHGGSGSSLLSCIRCSLTATNERDLVRKGTLGRTPERVLNGQGFRFTDDEVREIRASPLRGSEIAKRMGVLRERVYAVRKGRTYRYVDDGTADTRGQVNADREEKHGGAR